MIKSSALKSSKRFVRKIPIIGYITSLLWDLVILPRSQQYLKTNLATLKAQNSDNIRLLKTTENKLEAVTKKLNEKDSTTENLSNQLSDLKHRILALDLKNANLDEVTNEVSSIKLLADDHTLDKYYIDFENKFRGPEHTIENRLKVYIPYFTKSKVNFSKTPVLDIGCGRGELLKVLKDNSVNAIGIDLNKSMVDRAKENGFKAEQAEALSFLMRQKSNTFGAITGFHIAEHIPFSLLIRLFEECQRVLTKDGFIIFETPNPENIHVGSFSFYFDPSHLHPIPPEVMSFTVENRGFKKAEILRLHPKNGHYENYTTNDPLVKEIVDRFHGPQDYAVIGYK